MLRTTSGSLPVTRRNGSVHRWDSPVHRLKYAHTTPSSINTIAAAVGLRTPFAGMGRATVVLEMVSRHRTRSDVRPE